jgi:CheY-like chemotaxis protein
MSFATPKKLRAAPADVKGAVVLVVDDEPTWRNILETELRMLGYNPVAATDVTDALNQSFEHDPDVAIVDLMLPGSDGWHLLSEIRARGTSIPIIFYSAYPMARAENQHPDVVACVSKATGTASLYALLPSAIRTKKRLKRRPGSAPPVSPPDS